MIRTHQDRIGGVPGFEATIERFRMGSGVTQPGGDTLAEFQSPLTHDGDGPAGEFVSP